MSKSKVIHKANWKGDHRYACGLRFAQRDLGDVAPSARLWRFVTCKQCLARKGKR